MRDPKRPAARSYRSPPPGTIGNGVLNEPGGGASHPIGYCRPGKISYSDRAMRICADFPGGAAVEATASGHRIRTDQPPKLGGTDSAPAPFDLFLASIVTCAGFYALRFCQQRELDTRDLRVWLDVERDLTGKRVERLTLSLRVADDFPDKYRSAILRAMDQCAVKKHILAPPEFELKLAPASATA